MTSTTTELKDLQSELATAKAQLEACHQVIYRQYPYWRHIADLFLHGLKNKEVEQALQISKPRVSQHKRNLENLGILKAPNWLARRQAQAAQNFGHAKQAEANHHAH